MKVLVIGASGFVGRQLSRTLLMRDHDVRCLARDPAKIEDLAKAGSDVVKGDISDPASLQRALVAIEAVYISIHTLSPQRSETRGQGFMDIELRGLENIVHACRASGTKRVIYITALGTSPHAKAVWLRDRWRAEQMLLQSGLDVTILRPGQIVGKGGQGFDMMIAGARRPFALNLFGNGQQPMQNIALADLVYYLAGVLQDERTYGRAFDVGGDDVLTNDQMMDLAADVLGKPHPRKLRLPAGVVTLLAPVIERAAKLPHGAVRAILDCADTPMTGDVQPIRLILPRQPLAYREALRQTLTL